MLRLDMGVHACNPSYIGGIHKRSQLEAILGKNKLVRSYLKAS
jgi:hypothetical protein